MFVRKAYGIQLVEDYDFTLPDVYKFLFTMRSFICVVVNNTVQFYERLYKESWIDGDE